MRGLHLNPPHPSLYRGLYATRFYMVRYLGNMRYAVEDGRYVNCRCWYEDKKNGLRTKTNPECIIHGKE